MKIRAVVYTTKSAPEVPRFDEAWEISTAEINPEGVNWSLADTLQNPEVHRAALVDIEIPDAGLLPHLADPIPSTSGTVVAPRTD